MMPRIILGVLLLLLLVCMPQKLTPLNLQILEPINNETVNTDTIPVEGNTTVGATVYIGSTYSPAPSTPVAVDANGHFATQMVVEDMADTYSVCIKAKMDTRDLVECRLVIYQPLH